MTPPPSLASTLAHYGQSHLLAHIDTLSAEARRAYEADLLKLDLEEVTGFYRRTTEAAPADEGRLDDRMTPVPAELHGAVTRTPLPVIRGYERQGLEAVATGKVAVLLLAGGQGTRLGVAYPKGMYDVGLPSGKTLYQLQAERILAVERLARGACGGEGEVPWYIMTSEHTKEPTQQYFARHNHFGLRPQNLRVFEQGMLPCFSFDGKIILEAPGKIASAPDGNGGLYRALRNWDILHDMASRGVEYVHVYCVDNILVKMADPVFIGYCLAKGADAGAKVVEKAFPTEAVGVVCKVGGVHQVVEYSEITLPTAQRRNPDGRLTFSAGNICNHFFTLPFLRAVVYQHEIAMRHHVAKKKIPFCDATGATIKPDRPNGIKLEKFVFDVFQFSNTLAVWEVIREDEFSPLKNGDGAEKDTPTTCRHSVYSLHQRYLLNAGGELVDSDGEPLPLIPSPARALSPAECNNNANEKELNWDEKPVVVEISPLVSYGGEGLADTVQGKRFTCPLQLRHAQECASANGEAAADAATNGAATHTNGTANGKAAAEKGAALKKTVTGDVVVIEKVQA